MAENICCSGVTCNGLLTVGYMENMIPSTHCFRMKRGGTSYNGCCGEVSSSFTVVNYDQASGATYAELRYTNNSDPNDDTSGFIFNLDERNTANQCCQTILKNTILKRSEAFFEYTIAKNNEFTAITEPKICDTSYSVDELKTYDRHSVYCDGNGTTDTTDPISVTDTHTDSSDGSITKNYGEIASQTRAWTVSFDPSSKTITGLTTDDCGHSFSDSVTWTFPEYIVGYDRIGEFDSDFRNGNKPKVPCAGRIYKFVYSANTVCSSDFEITYEILSEGQDYSTDDSITVTSSTTSHSSIGNEDDRKAEIDVITVTINIGQNKNSKNNGSIKINTSVNGDSYEDVYEFDRELCAWTAGDTSDPEGCSGYWPEIVNWSNPPYETEVDIQDVIEINNN